MTLFLFSYPSLAAVGFQECSGKTALSTTKGGIANNQTIRMPGPFPEETIGTKVCPPGNRSNLRLTERTSYHEPKKDLDSSSVIAE